jgi:hypothetical protein
MAEKVIFGEAATPNVVPPPKPNQPIIAASANSNKTAAQAKASYSYPWGGIPNRQHSNEPALLFPCRWIAVTWRQHYHNLSVLNRVESVPQEKGRHR